MKSDFKLKTIRQIFLLTKIMYLLCLVFEIALYLVGIPMHIQLGLPTNSVLELILGFEGLVLSAVAFILAKYALTAYDLWRESSVWELDQTLRAIIKTLYITVVLDAANLLFYYFSGLTVRSPEEIAKQSSAAAYVDYFRPMYEIFIKFFLPRPIGLAAILLALLISVTLKDRNTNTQP